MHVDTDIGADGVFALASALCSANRLAKLNLRGGSWHAITFSHELCCDCLCLQVAMTAIIPLVRVEFDSFPFCVDSKNEAKHTCVGNAAGDEAVLALSASLKDVPNMTSLDLRGMVHN